MKLTHLAALVALICASVGCTTAPEIPEVAQLRWVTNSNPVADAKKALAAGQRNLFAVWGVTWSIPGVSDQEKMQYRQRYGVKFIEGTGDVLYSEEHAQLVKKAHFYAEKYNRHMLNQLRNE